MSAYCGRMEVLYLDAPGDIREGLLQDVVRDPSLVSEEDLTSLGDNLGVTLPTAFLAYLQTGLAGGVERDECYLPGVPGEDPLGPISEYLFDGSLRPLGYLQFACGPCADPVCFDLGGSAHGEYRVVCFNHDLIPHHAWLDRETLRQYEEELAPSFATFLEWLCGDEGGSKLS